MVFESSDKLYSSLRNHKDVNNIRTVFRNSLNDNVFRINTPNGSRRTTTSLYDDTLTAPKIILMFAQGTSLVYTALTFDHLADGHDGDLEDAGGYAGYAYGGVNGDTATIEYSSPTYELQESTSDNNNHRDREELNKRVKANISEAIELKDIYKDYSSYA